MEEGGMSVGGGGGPLCLKLMSDIFTLYMTLRVTQHNVSLS